MGLIAQDKGGADFELVPEDTYVARCYRILDLGTQKGSDLFGGKEQHKVMISWELLSEPFMQEGDNKGKPFSIHKRYTVSLGEKASLRQDLEAWRGRKFTKEELDGFDLAKIMGQYCNIQVVHDESGKYANVNAIMAFKGEKPKPVNKDVVFDIDNPDMEVFDSLSDSIKGTIMQAPEWKGNQKPLEPHNRVDDVVVEDIEGEPVNLDEIPF